MRRLAAYLWASPVSLAALPLGALALATGGRARWRGGVLEAHGGWLEWLLSRAFPTFPIGAITLGHVVLAADAAQLEACRSHELAHVRQYERWGALFPFLYAGSSLLAFARGGHLYEDNVFEREAYRA